MLERNHRRLTAHRTALARAAGLVHGPTDGTMIDNGMRGIAKADAVHRLLAGIPQPAPHKTHDDIVATAHAGAPVCQANPLARRRLPRHREIALPDDTG